MIVVTFNQNMIINLLIGILLLVGHDNNSIDAFVHGVGKTRFNAVASSRPSWSNRSLQRPTRSSSSKSTKTQLSLDFGGLENFFNLNGKFNQKKITKKNDDDIIDGKILDDDGEEIDEDYPGCTNIFTIKVKSLKVGGCRLYLSLFFMGQSNVPTKGSWKMNQNGDGGIDMYYKDTSGALIIEFKNDAIVVKRLGSSPSMEYLMQESSMLTGMLDQLDEIAMDSSINESDRLICIDDDEINMVRESLSFT